MKLNYKEILRGFLGIVIYFTLSKMETLPFYITGVDITSIPSYLKIIYLIIYEILMIAVMMLLFYKKLKKDFIDILKNHKKYYGSCMKYYLIGLGVMLLSNAFIIFILKGGIANNEEAVRDLFKITPIYIYLSAVIFAPITEELTFRQSIRDICGKNIWFVLISGITFGALHVVTSINGLSDLLYIIPYSALGVSFAYMLYKTNNIFVSMGFHFMHNGILVAIQFLALLFS